MVLGHCATTQFPAPTTAHFATQLRTTTCHLAGYRQVAVVVERYLRLNAAGVSRYHSSTTMIVPADQTPLFTLPLELRQLVYKAVLASPLHGPELLQTCQEIHLEAHKFLFARPLSFRSQEALFDWLDRVPKKYLPQVKELSLNIQDVDLRSLLKASALISHPGDPPRLLTWNIYEAELDKLFHALEQLPKVQKITIRAVSGRQSFLYREFLQKFLRLLGSLYPNLLDLGLEGNLHHQDLSFISSFTRLQAFLFDGFSASSPSDTARILSELGYLKCLSLVSQSTMLTPGSQTRSGFTAKRQSLTGGVVNRIDSLKCFSITEIIPISAPTLFFTPEVLTSLHNHQSLKVIKVCLSQAPNNETMAAFESFLENTHIKILELDWPQLDPHVLETFSLIPDGLEKLWIRARSAADAFYIIWSIAESRNAGDLHALSELNLLRSTQTYDDITPATNDRKDSGTGEVEGALNCMYPAFDDTDAINVVRARLRLQTLGVRVSWCTERP
ncbi:hypothetical protein BU25DRAFT_14768 [Macroventuria anomochaeta]|uniref:Uncharacterized protein n=1 Tax=Macroventuria anomochaeta TaxID=301207 RepID=A0ACB6SIK7_9PLEO|nr:uncharacterized protein BU25DRAFT_14768 [Macroventuria anomochaeta]KAF2633904.1 hypothetical protein BU25DRAFT_14768 [Macroventuria anomochaeta]